MKRILPLLLFLLFAVLFTPHSVSAHEQYVLTDQQIKQGFADKSINVLNSLRKAENVKLTISIGAGIFLVLLLYFFFQFSPVGKYLDKKLKSLENLGHVTLRIALATLLIMSASYHAFLGPEIPVTALPFATMLVPILYILGLFLLFGLFTRVVSLLALCILAATTFVYGDYMLTYFNYYGEFIALLIFGSYVFSMDNKFFGIPLLVNKYKEWEIFLIRVTYGISVIYPAVTIKLLHPKIIIDIVNQYHMTDITWLFPNDPLLISLGAGIIQVLVGMLIVVGLETRLASLITFVLYLMSVLFFKEAVWPHYVLLALAFYLVLNNGGKIGLDYLIGQKLVKLKQEKRKRS